MYLDLRIEHEMNIAIGAIFRDEFDYLIEWFAWHEMAGFQSFYIADNGSTDGTLALLEAMAELGRIQLIYQPVVEKQAQLRAYNRIAQQAIGIADAILYIDADEFLTHESMIDGDEYRHLAQLLSRPDVGMVGINWRCFGSSGHKEHGPQPVIERFTDCCSDYQFSKNGHIKSASKISLTKYIGPHKSDFFTSDCFGHILKVDCVGVELSGYISFEGGSPQPVENSGVTSSVASAPLRINHYVIKSEREYAEKKVKRGDVMQGVNYQRSMQYFSHHDFKDCTFIFPFDKISRLKSNMASLEDALNSTVFGKKIRGALDMSNHEGLQGWLVDESGSSKNLKINVFVNGVHQGRVACGYLRPDLLEKGISVDGLSGFRYTHPAPLKSGDVVEVRVHGNRYQFPQRAHTIIK